MSECVHLLVRDDSLYHHSNIYPVFTGIGVVIIDPCSTDSIFNSSNSESPSINLTNTHEIHSLSLLISQFAMNVLFLNPCSWNHSLFNGIVWGIHSTSHSKSDHPENIYHSFDGFWIVLLLKSTVYPVKLLSNVAPSIHWYVIVYRIFSRLAYRSTTQLSSDVRFWTSWLSVYSTSQSDVVDHHKNLCHVFVYAFVVNAFNHSLYVNSWSAISHDTFVIFAWNFTVYVCVFHCAYNVWSSFVVTVVFDVTLSHQVSNVYHHVNVYHVLFWTVDNSPYFDLYVTVFDSVFATHQFPLNVTV